MLGVRLGGQRRGAAEVAGEPVVLLFTDDEACRALPVLPLGVLEALLAGEAPQPLGGREDVVERAVEGAAPRGSRGHVPAAHDVHQREQLRLVRGGRPLRIPGGAWRRVRRRSGPSGSAPAGQLLAPLLRVPHQPQRLRPRGRRGGAVLQGAGPGELPRPREELLVQLGRAGALLGGVVQATRRQLLAPVREAAGRPVAALARGPVPGHEEAGHQAVGVHVGGRGELAGLSVRHLWCHPGARAAELVGLR
mmetsp:Transcript_3754/g.11011  ORF Transcript_3754/g.11011 Transcript_3754/m.11011 type:complete len:250 (+) Transcript_3754:73-822(+)